MRKMKDYEEKICFLQNRIFEVLKNEVEDEFDKNTWYMSLAANFLHDVPDDMRRDFLNNYEEMRKEINKFYG